MKKGRPRLAKSERKGIIAGVRLNADERRLLERAAARRTQTLSQWMRSVLLATASVHANTDSNDKIN